jgi:hypothetical protein
MAARSDLSFEEFIEFQFGPAVRMHGNAWYFDLDADWWEPEPRTGIAYLTQLFSDGANVLESFHDDQIAQGLTGLVNIMAVGDQPWMRDPVTPAEERAAVWPAIADFFRDVLASRCEPSLGHLASEMPPPINTVTYMWWESFPGFANPDDPQRGLVDDAELKALESILGIDSVACQEAALHGLGHWVRRELRCAEVIDRYLSSGGVAVPELRSYAEAARSGCIL